MLTSGEVGTPGRLQCSVFVVDGAVPFAAEDVVLVCDVGAGPRFEFGEFVGAVRVQVEESVEERLQIGLEWVEDNSAVVEAFMCSSRWH